ncbi:S41 family peptidase [Hyphobacterium sp.]|uniref:S41 family peptidase n=1 Tax=Hyphobacterium sp. TaxID=2004662 RepID=UPI003BAC1A07
MPSRVGDFRRFLDDSFRELSARGAGTLIIDIRDNEGGDWRAGSLLHRYITDRDYPAIGRVDVRVTERIQAYYRTLLPAGFRWLPLHRLVPILRRIQTGEPGSVFSIHPDGEAPRDWRSETDNAFRGRLIVVTGPATYSSAVIFAAPLHHYGRAILISEETGERTVFFGENYVFDLPNSRLQVAVSHKRSDLVGDGDHQTGLRPDISVDASEALEAAIEYAASRHRGVTVE